MSETAIRLRNAIIRWQDNRGELAEILKAEAEAKVNGIENSVESTITARRKDGDRQALEFTKESLEFRAKIDIDEQWIGFYSLLITQGIHIDLTGCP